MAKKDKIELIQELRNRAELIAGNVSLMTLGIRKRCDEIDKSGRMIAYLLKDTANFLEEELGNEHKSDN